MLLPFSNLSDIYRKKFHYLDSQNWNEKKNSNYFWLLCLLCTSLIPLLPLSFISGDADVPTKRPCPDSYQQSLENKVKSKTNSRRERKRGTVDTVCQVLLNFVKIAFCHIHKTIFWNCSYNNPQIYPVTAVH